MVRQKDWKDEPGTDEALGRAIRVIRTERGLNRKELAKRSGISYPYLSEIEGGKKSPSSKALKALGDALGVPPSEFLVAADSLAQGPRSWTLTSPPPVAPAAAPPPRPAAVRPVAASPPPAASMRRMSPPPVEAMIVADSSEADAAPPDDLDLIEILEMHARALSREDLERLIDFAARLGRP